MTQRQQAGAPAPDPARGQLSADQMLKAGSIGAFGIVFMVVATASPLAGTIGNTPLAIGLGNGVGTPGAFLVAAIVLALFAVGYAAMSRHITNAGAFYAYISAGLGPRLGTAGGFVALLAYNVLAVYMVGFIGFFANSVLASELGVDIPWWILGIGLLGASMLLAMRGVELNARLLGLILAVEMSLLAAFVVAVLVNGGPGAFPTDSFAPSQVFGAGAGVTLMFAFLSYIGFEATAIFGEEAKDPHRTVPRATYIAIGALALFYIVAAWAVIASYGGADAQAAAAKDPGNLVFAAAGVELGDWATHAFSWIMLTGSFAVLCAIHNMSSRYLLAFGREGLLPSTLGRTHPKYKTPVAAGLVQAAFTAGVALVYVIAGADPYLNLVSQMAGVGTLGVVALQAVAAAAVVGFFWRRPERHVWKTVIAPGLACVGLTTACVLIVENYTLLSGSTSRVVNGLPWLLVVVAIIGFIVGSVRPMHRPMDILADYEPVPLAAPARAPAG